MSSCLVWETPHSGIWCPSIINTMEERIFYKPLKEKKKKKKDLCAVSHCGLKKCSLMTFSVVLAAFL